ncbi:Restriction modification system DNA specificity domain protein [Thiocapsa sp. KS1]|nr:restriction endonuclease subunit S [Thiocapsa sp. KS1]CRI63158.1 Restriction modification system DNA specificity domain protein [Thiocapsa sp. KS1]
MRHQTYPRYKPSGAEWLGEVPEHWDVKALKWESPVLRGASPRPIDNEIYFDDEGEYAWVRIADVSAAGMYLRETTQRLSELGQSLSVPLEPGALFLSIAGTVGKPCITAIKCCIHDGFVYFPYWRDDSRFLYFLFASGEPYKGLGKLGTQLNLNTDTVGSIVAGFPPSAEQQAIADFLVREMAKLDALVAKKRALIERLKEKRTALISRTVTRGLPPDAARAAGLDPHPKLKPSGIDWLGDVPEHWTVKALKWESPVLRGASPRPIDNEIYFDEEGEYAWVRIADVSAAGMYLHETTQRLSDLGRSLSVPLQPGVLFLSIAGSVGKPCITAIKCCIHDGFVYFPFWRGEARFLYYLFASGEPYKGLGKLGTQLNLNTDTVGSIVAGIPAIVEQHAIGDFLDHETARIDGMIAKVETAIARLQEYRTALITAAVTGKIDVRNPDVREGASHAPASLS